ncbi:MAG: AMP-binding protein [Gemmatimonadetes bacterium]|nr:AMP-binding protein [Gemmatimonadota bacterium]
MSDPADVLFDHEAEAPSNWSVRQDALAREAVRIAWEDTGEGRARLERCGMDPQQFGGVSDLKSVQVLSKDTLPELQAQDPPFGGMLAVPVASLKRVYQSPGPIMDPEGQGVDFWRMAPAAWAAGFRAGDVVLNTLSYHLTPGGHMLDAGLRHVGCVVIPGGVGNTADQLRMVVAAGATGYVGTPQFLRTMVERARQEGLTHSIERALVTGAPLPDSLRAELQDEFGISVYQAYGTADAGTLGYECREKEGWHVAPGVVVEILTPGNGDPVATGDPGEVVVTIPNPTYPLVRFGTGDLSAFHECPCRCDRTSPRLVGFLGRVGEGVKVKGMFVHPRQLAEALASDPTVARFQAIVTADGHNDVLTVQVEPSSNAKPEPEALQERLEAAVKLRLTLEVVPAGAIEEGGAPLVDRRGGS